LAILDKQDIKYTISNIREPEMPTFDAEGSTPAPFGEIDAAMADAMARTHQRIAEIGKAMDEILEKHGGSYEAAEADQEYLKLASEYTHLSRALLRIQNVMRD
jgi:tRNA isopentenyl-2-thiomethyl-A-37 hydroxylase MiaE